ncbi:hypothetical protein [Echinicola shivajiensis]|uniref:hypothetical protein n=1 Tax=Echinicola shivajiensis TaxID=1035916 RepID=UPI001BFCBDEA|nr:hypothetical protein [Echinicola shivajiensis]
MELPLKSQENYNSISIGAYSEEDYIEPLNIELYSHMGQPVFYSSEFPTTVCEDKICEILYIKLFWDLTGNYIGYDTLSGHPLTKFDHEPFKAEDYVKLHELLLNEGTILKFKRKDELIDKKMLKPSDVIDGTTGATALEIKEEVVMGALYTSYTLWHIAHKGEIENLLNKQTKEFFTPQLAKEFMQSEIDDYRIFAVEQMSTEELSEDKSFLLESLENGNPLLRKSILRKIPNNLLEDKPFQLNVCELFGRMDINTKSYLLNSLKQANLVHSESMGLLLKNVSGMSKNQLSEFLEIISSKKLLNDSLKVKLLELAESDYRYAYVILDAGLLD